MGIAKGRYTIALPPRIAARMTAPRKRGPGRRVLEQERGSDATAEYLDGLPTLPDFLSHLAAGSHLTAAEEACIGRYVNKLCRQIREAREAWESEQLNTILCQWTSCDEPSVSRTSAFPKEK